MNLRRILRFTLVALLGNAFSKALLMAAELYFAAILDAAAYGLFALGLAIVLIGGSGCLLGLNYGLLQFVSIELERGRQGAAVALEVVGIGVAALCATLVAVAFWLAAPAVAVLFKEPQAVLPILYWSALVVPLETCNQGIAACLKARRRFRAYTIVWDLARSACVAVLIPVHLLGGTLSIELVLEAYLAGSALCTAIGLGLIRRDWVSTRPIPWRQTLPEVRAMMRFSLPLAVWGMLQKSANRLFVIVSGFFLTLEQVGVVGLSTRLMLALNLFKTAVNASTPGEFARLLSTQKMDRIRGVYRGVVAYLTVASAVVVLPFLVAPQYILHYVGSEFASYWWAMVPLVAAKFANVSSGPAGNLLIAFRRSDIVYRVTAVDLLLQFIAVGQALYLWGLPGGIAAESLRMVAVVVLRHLLARRAIAIQTLEWRDVGITLSVLAIGAGVYLAFEPVASLLQFCAATAAALVLFAPVAYLVLRRGRRARASAVGGGKPS